MTGCAASRMTVARAVGIAGSAVALVAPAAPAQAQYLGGGTMSSAEAQVADLEQLRDKFTALAGAFPAETWDWRPMEGVRSTRDVMALIAAEPTLLPTLWGFEAPPWVPEPDIGAELGRIRALSPGDTRAEIVRAFGHLLTLVAGLDEAERTRPVSFFGLEVPLETAVTFMANDMHEHLGQLVAYARMNRVVPPWSRPRDAGGAGQAPRPGDVFVANLQSSEVAWFDGASGAYRGAFVDSAAGGLQGGTGIAFGPDGDLFVGSARNHRILRYDGMTGVFEGAFVSGGELESPFSLVFGPGGDLYVSSGTGDRVLRYDGRTGAFEGVAARGDGLRQPIGLAFGPRDGLLYVVNSAGRSILRFDPETGESRGTFATDSLAFPSDAAFGPDGDLYVSNAASSSVVRFDGTSGAFVETVLRLPGDGGVPMGLAFRGDGSLVVGDFGRNRLYVLDAGGREPRLVAEDGLGRPENLAIKPAGR